MKNFNGSLSDLGIIKNEEENSSDRERIKSNQPLKFNNFNDSPTDFNNEIIMKETDIYPYEITLSQEANDTDKI
jgi:hypothetical protein